MQDCIFCKIAGHEINARFVHETDELAAFQDLNPQAPTHIIIVPKKHIPRLSEAAPEDMELLGKLQYAVKEIAENSAWRIISGSYPITAARPGSR